MMDGARRVIHPKTLVAPHPQLDIFAVPPTQCSIERDIVTEVRPLSNVATGQPIEFLISTPPDEYIQFCETYIYIRARVKLYRPDQAVPRKEDWDSVVPVQYFLHSLFSQCDILLDNNEIAVAPQTYQYRSYLEALLGFAESAKKTHLRAALWGTVDQRRKAVLPVTGSGHEGRWFEMMGRLHLDFTFQHRMILGGCNLRLKLLPSDPKFYFNAAPGLRPELELAEVKLEVHSSRLYPSIVSAHSEALRQSPAVYALTRCEVKRLGIPKGQLDFVQDVIRGPIPRRMFVVFVDTNAFNGSYQKDPYEFKNYGINFCQVYVNSIAYPTAGYTPDFANNMVVSAYMKLMQALDQNGTDVYTDLSLEDFARDKAIFAFDFAPDLSNGPGSSGHANVITDGVMRLGVRFSTQTPEAINVLMYCEYDECYGIDSNRSIVKSFE